jgi:integrase/recombinase XerD
VHIQSISLLITVLLQSCAQEELAHRAHPLSKKRFVLPVVLNKQEVFSLIETAATPKNKAIISTLYATGARLAELVNIRISDIDGTRKVLTIRQGKGGKDRAVPLSDKLLAYLRDYWRSCADKPTTWLFPGSKTDKPLGMRWVQQIVKDTAQKAGIKKRVSPHTLRHSFATHLLEAGVNVRVIQFLMGHRNLRATAVYMHVAQNFVNQAKSPLDALYAAEVSHA